VRIWFPALLLALLASACAHSPARIDSRALANTPKAGSDRLIIAAVDNGPTAFMARAGGTPRGYDSIAAYGPTSTAQATLHALEAEYGMSEVNAWPIEPLHIHCAVLRLPEGADREAVMAALARDQRVKLVQPLQLFATRSEVYNDPYVGLQHGFQLMDVASAHSWSRGDGVRVAVVDTGADTAHTDLSGRIAAAENFVDSDAAQFRRDRHGTEIAGVIAAVANNHEGIVGVAPGARLLILKACWQVQPDADAASCNSFTLARALSAALDAHAQIVNLSLTGPRDPLLSGLIREGLRRGVLFVGAAGPEEVGAAPSLLQQPGTIEAASSEKPPRDEPVLYAPGREILTLLPGGHYDFATGDSIATAEVTGVVALLLAKNHALSAANAFRLLRDTSAAAVVHTDLGSVPEPGRAASEAARNEQVNACAAVTALVGQGSCKAVAAHQFVERLPPP
jgi:subtilisin family serine protease